MLTQGLIVPLVTPLNAGGGLDEAGLVRLVDQVRQGGVDALFLLGTTGEALSLSLSTRRQLVEAAARLAPDLPLLVCVTDTCLEQSLTLAHHARAAGAAGIVAAPPAYYPLSERELFDYFTTLAQAAPLPLLLYNIPQTTRAVLSPELVAELAQQPRIVGYKDSGGDWLAFARTLALVGAARPDFALLMGDERLLAQAIAAGAHGGVCGNANAEPLLLRRLIDAARAGATAALDQHRAELAQLHQLYAVGSSWSRYITHLKLLLERQGICARHVAPPLQTPMNAEAQAVVSWCERWVAQRRPACAAVVA